MHREIWIYIQSPKLLPSTHTHTHWKPKFTWYIYIKPKKSCYIFNYPKIFYCRYGLDNGSIGVYKEKTRLWKVKAKHKVVSVISVQADKSIFCLVIGWSNGRVEVRNDVTGEILYKMSLNSPIAKILQGDYRMDGTL